MDTKNSELIGNFKNKGRRWCRQPDEVNAHDFPGEAQCGAIPYGISDVTLNRGQVCVGTSADMPEFAVRSIRNWWKQFGRKQYAHPSHLLIEVDSGGSNGCRPRLWKGELQILRSLSNARLVELMKHRNEWYVRQARLILAERSHSGEEGEKVGRSRDGLRAACASLRQMVHNADAVEAYRALVTLHAMGATDSKLLRKLLSHRKEHLRAWAVRLLTDDWPIDGIFGPAVLSQAQTERIDAECRALLDEFCKMAAEDQSGLVRLTLASTIQRMPVARRGALAGRLME